MNDFDRIIDRSNTNSLAVEGFVDYLFKGDEEVKLSRKKTDLISMWVAADSAPGANDGADVTARRDLAVAGELTAARGVVGTATFYQGGGAVFQSDQAVTMQTAAGGGVWSARHNGVTISVPQTAHGNFTMDDGMGTVRLRLNQADGSIDCGDVRGDAATFTGALDAQAGAGWRGLYEVHQTLEVQSFLRTCLMVSVRVMVVG